MIWVDFQEAMVMTFGPVVSLVGAATIAMSIIAAAFEILSPLFRRLIVKS